MTERAARCKSLASARGDASPLRQGAPARLARGVERGRRARARGRRARASARARPKSCCASRPRAGVVHPSVLLLPGDLAWECDCGSDDDPCAHVAAGGDRAAGRRARGEDALRAGDGGRGTVAYRFRATPAGLALERAVIHADGETPLRTTLSALASGSKAGPPVAPTRLDLTVESTLGSQREGALPRGILRALLPVLEGASEVTLDGARSRPRASRWAASRASRTTPAASASSSSRSRAPSATSAAASCSAGGVLRELAPLPLSGRERDELTGRGKHFTADQAAELVADVLPSLRRRMPVVVESKRLPSTRAEPPRIAIETARAGDGLSVLATLVYGEPALRARRRGAARAPRGRGTASRRRRRGAPRGAARRRARARARPARRARARGRDRLRRAARALRRPEDGRRRARVPARPCARAGALARGGRLHASLSGSPGRPRTRSRSRARAGGVPARRVARAAPRRRLRAAPGRLARALRRPRSRTCSPRAALGPAHRGGPPRSRAALRRARRAAAARLRAPRGASLAGDWPEAPLPADLRAELRPYQREGVRWLAFLRRGRARRAPRRRHGPRQDAPGARRAPRPDARGRADQPARQLGGGDRALPAGAARGRLPRRRAARSTRAPTSRSRATRSCAATATCSRPSRGTPSCSTRRRRSRTRRARWRRPPSRSRGARRIALTGTPVENRLDELWSLFHFLNPGLLGGRSRLRRALRAADRRGRRRGAASAARAHPAVRAAAPEGGGRARAAAAHRGGAARRALRGASAPSTTRSRASDARGGAGAARPAGGGVLAALEALLRLRQACCHPRAPAGPDARRAPPKLELLVERSRPARREGHKALVFSQWTCLLDLVEPRARAPRASPSRGSTARPATAPRSSRASRPRAGRPSS